MLHLVYQCEDTIRSKLPESNSKTCSRDFSFAGSETMRNYFTRRRFVSINCFDPSANAACRFFAVLDNGSYRHKRETLPRARDSNDGTAGLGELRDRTHRSIRAFYFSAPKGRSYSPISRRRQVSAPRTRRNVAPAA